VREEGERKREARGGEKEEGEVELCGKDEVGEGDGSTKQFCFRESKKYQ